MPLKSRFTRGRESERQAISEELERLAKTRLARECAKLDPAEERALAEEGLAAGPVAAGTAKRY